jgi:hypothetical protein
MMDVVAGVVMAALAVVGFVRLMQARRRLP